MCMQPHTWLCMDAHSHTYTHILMQSHSCSYTCTSVYLTVAAPHSPSVPDRHNWFTEASTTMHASIISESPTEEMRKLTEWDVH